MYELENFSDVYYHVYAGHAQKVVDLGEEKVKELRLTKKINVCSGSGPPSSATLVFMFNYFSQKLLDWLKLWCVSKKSLIEDDRCLEDCHPHEEETPDRHSCAGHNGHIRHKTNGAHVNDAIHIACSRRSFFSFPLSFDLSMVHFPITLCM